MSTPAVVAAVVGAALAVEYVVALTGTVDWLLLYLMAGLELILALSTVGVSTLSILISQTT